MDINTQPQEQSSQPQLPQQQQKQDFTKQNLNIDPQIREKYKQNYLKVKVGIFFGYNGKNYHGLQKNENVETIEGVLEQALYHADFIPPYNFGWGRGGRTDKGVHAVCNVINVKLCIHKDYTLNNYEELVEEAKKNLQNINSIKREFDWKKIIQRINIELPKSIQVLAIKKVTAKFNVRKMARSRIYEYFCPITLFRPQSAELIDELKKQIKNIEGTTKEIQKEINKKIDQMIIDSNKDKPYEYSQEDDESLVKKINELCKEYIGTKNFHNYTVKLKWSDPSAKRYMLEIDAKLVNPYDILKSIQVQNEKIEQILQTNGKIKFSNSYLKLDKKLPQFLLFRIHGQSFMYHQIRKMMGMMIQMLQENLNLSYMQNSFFGNTYDIWLGPPEGLLMNRVKSFLFILSFQITFEGYNYKQIPEKIEFNEEEEKQMQNFKEEFIYSQIIFEEFFDYKLIQKFLQFYRFTIWLGRQLSQCKNMEIEENEDIKADDD